MTNVANRASLAPYSGNIGLKETSVYIKGFGGGHDVRMEALFPIVSTITAKEPFVDVDVSRALDEKAVNTQYELDLSVENADLDIDATYDDDDSDVKTPVVSCFIGAELSIHPDDKYFEIIPSRHLLSTVERLNKFNEATTLWAKKSRMSAPPAFFHWLLTDFDRPDFDNYDDDVLESFYRVPQDRKRFITTDEIFNYETVDANPFHVPNTDMERYQIRVYLYLLPYIGVSFSSQEMVAALGLSEYATRKNQHMMVIENNTEQEAVYRLRLPKEYYKDAATAMRSRCTFYFLKPYQTTVVREVKMKSLRDESQLSFFLNDVIQECEGKLRLSQCNRIVLRDGIYQCHFLDVTHKSAATVKFRMALDDVLATVLPHSDQGLMDRSYGVIRYTDPEPKRALIDFPSTLYLGLQTIRPGPFIGPKLLGILRRDRAFKDKYTAIPVETCIFPIRVTDSEIDFRRPLRLQLFYNRDGVVVPLDIPKYAIIRANICVILRAFVE